MKPDFILHLQHNWPLAIVIAGLLIYLPIVLLGGVFFTNQGRVVRSDNPSLYWRWVWGFIVLLLVLLLVFFGSYLLPPN
jgi:hypothetical protein